MTDDLDQEIANLERLLAEKKALRDARFVLSDASMRRGLPEPSGGDALPRDKYGHEIRAGEPLVPRRLVGGPDRHSEQLQHQIDTMDFIERRGAAQRRDPDDAA